ncbi:MAG: GIY-YIG nuclease family protein [Bacillaceae bacterium]
MEKSNEHYFYVLECNDGTYYAGYTNDLNRRLIAHNSGKGAKYTRVRTPVKMIYTETFDDKREAMQKEYRFKQLTRKQKEQYMKRNGENETAKKLSGND